MESPSYSDAVVSEIRAEMARQRKNQAELAIVIGVTPPGASRRMRGDTPLDVAELKLITDWLGMTVPDLLARVSNDSAGVSA